METGGSRSPSRLMNQKYSSAEQSLVMSHSPPPPVTATTRTNRSRRNQYESSTLSESVTVSDDDEGGDDHAVLEEEDEDEGSGVLRVGKTMRGRIVEEEIRSAEMEVNLMGSQSNLIKSDSEILEEEMEEDISRHEEAVAAIHDDVSDIEIIPSARGDDRSVEQSIDLNDESERRREQLNELNNQSKRSVFNALNESRRSGVSSRGESRSSWDVCKHVMKEFAKSKDDLVDDRNSESSGGGLSATEHSMNHHTNEARNKVRRFRLFCGKIVENSRVQTGIIVLIILNAIMMGIGTFDFVTENPEIAAAFAKTDRAFLYVFTIEIGLQFIYRSFALFTDGWLLFDFIIVMSSWSLEQLQIIRAFRIFRAFRLITRIKPLRELVMAIVEVLPRIYAIALLLMLIFYIFSVLFTELFKDLELSANYFKTLDASLFTCMELMTLEWAGIAREVMHQKPWAWAPFLGFIMVTGFIVFNLIVAVVCDAVAVVNEPEEDSEIEKDKDKLQDAQMRIWDLTDQVEIMALRQEEMEEAIATLAAALQEANFAISVPATRHELPGMHDPDDGSGEGEDPDGFNRAAMASQLLQASNRNLINRKSSALRRKSENSESGAFPSYEDSEASERRGGSSRASDGLPASIGRQTLSEGNGVRLRSDNSEWAQAEDSHHESEHGSRADSASYLPKQNPAVSSKTANQRQSPHSQGEDSPSDSFYDCYETPDTISYPTEGTGGGSQNKASRRDSGDGPSVNSEPSAPSTNDGNAKAGPTPQVNNLTGTHARKHRDLAVSDREGASLKLSQRIRAQKNGMGRETKPVNSPSSEDVLTVGASSRQPSRNSSARSVHNGSDDMESGTNAEMESKTNAENVPIRTVQGPEVKSTTSSEDGLPPDQLQEMLRDRAFRGSPPHSHASSQECNESQAEYTV